MNTVKKWFEPWFTVGSLILLASFIVFEILLELVSPTVAGISLLAGTIVWLIYRSLDSQTLRIHEVVMVIGFVFLTIAAFLS